MRTCDGIFSVNFAAAWLTQQECGAGGIRLQPDPRQDVGLKPDLHQVQPHLQQDRCNSALAKFFSPTRASRVVSRLDNVRTSLLKKFRSAPRDIHRSGGKLLDNTRLTSRARGGSLHVGWIARSLITPHAAAPLQQRPKKSRAPRRFFAMATPTHAFASTKNHQTSKEAIAEETHTSIDEVEKIYDQELTQLSTGAKITQFLGVLTTKRVRMRLRKH
jgi:hypothetical protein